MKRCAGARARGFTLIELMVALLILAIVAMMSYRGLAAVLDARDHVAAETGKWRSVASFLARFERDVRMAAPRSVRTGAGIAPAWRATPAATIEPRLEFSRFASAEGTDSPRRVAYALNAKREIELWLWPGLDLASAAQPARYAVLAGVTALEFQYFSADLAWVSAWPASPRDAALPRAVRLRVVLASGEEIVRVFALGA